VEKWKAIKPVADGHFYFGFGYGADMNGFGSQGGPRGANAENPVTYPFKSFVGDVTFDKQKSGERVYDINVEGVDHYGLYPDWIEDLRKLAGDEIVEDMARGAESYLQMWERAVGVPSTVCRGAHLGFNARGLGGIELGANVERLLRTATQPQHRAPRTFEWCVEGKSGRAVGKTVAVLTPEGTVGLAASSARTHVAKGVHAGTRAKRARRKTRAFGKGVRVRRASKGSRAKLVYVMKGKRVRYVAVASPAAAKDRATLRSYLNLAGL
jgi:hypothetical protein